MNREMAAMFPSGIRALIVDDDARFIKSSSMLLSLLNFKVASCGSPTSALKLLSAGDKNKDVDVVLVNAEKAATCGFDFRGIVESDLSIPVIYFLSRDHVATGDEADELLRTLRDSTYVLTSPLQANDVCDLWMLIGWRKCYLEKKASKGPDDGRRVVPAAAVQAFMAGGSSSTAVDDEEREDEDRIHFKVVGARRRGRKRKSGCSTVAAGSSGTTVAAGGQAKTQGKINVTGGHERDDVSIQQQPASATEKAALPFVCHQEQHPAAATTIEATATTSRWNWNQPAAGNVIPLTTAVANRMAMSTTVTYEPEFSRGSTSIGNQQQQNVCPPLMFGPFPYQGPPPPVLKEVMFVPLPRYSGTESIGGGATVVGTSAAGAGEHGNAAATSLIQTLNPPGTEPDGHDELAAMMAMCTESNPPVAKAAATEAMCRDNSSTLMAPHQQQISHGVAVAANRAEATDALNTTNNFINYSGAAAAVAPQNVGHGSVASKQAAARQEVLNNGDDDFISNYSTSLMAPNQVLDMASTVNELTMAGGAFFSNANDDAYASFTAPHQDLAAAPDGDQQLIAPGALDAIAASLMGSPSRGAAMDGNPGLELELGAMFSPDQYDNTMFPLEALLGLDDAPVYEAGLDYQQQQGGGGAAGGASGDAAGTTSLIGGADDNLDVLDDYLFMDSTGDFNNGRE